MKLVSTNSSDNFLGYQNLIPSIGSYFEKRWLSINPGESLYNPTSPKFILATIPSGQGPKITGSSVMIGWNSCTVRGLYGVFQVEPVAFGGAPDLVKFTISNKGTTLPSWAARVYIVQEVSTGVGYARRIDTYWSKPINTVVAGDIAAAQYTPATASTPGKFGYVNSSVFATIGGQILNSNGVETYVDNYLNVFSEGINKLTFTFRRFPKTYIFVESLYDPNTLNVVSSIINTTAYKTHTASIAYAAYSLSYQSMYTAASIGLNLQIASSAVLPPGPAPTRTPTSTPTRTSTPTCTCTPTKTPWPTSTPTNTRTPSATPRPSNTPTPTPTSTKAPTTPATPKTPIVTSTTTLPTAACPPSTGWSTVSSTSDVKLYIPSFFPIHGFVATTITSTESNIIAQCLEEWSNILRDSSSVIPSVAPYYIKNGVLGADGSMRLERRSNCVVYHKQDSTTYRMFELPWSCDVKHVISFGDTQLTAAKFFVNRESLSYPSRGAVTIVHTYRTETSQVSYGLPLLTSIIINRNLIYVTSASSDTEKLKFKALIKREICQALGFGQSWVLDPILGDPSNLRGTPPPAIARSFLNSNRNFYIKTTGAYTPTDVDSRFWPQPTSYDNSSKAGVDGLLYNSIQSTVTPESRFGLQVRKDEYSSSSKYPVAARVYGPAGSSADQIRNAYHPLSAATVSHAVTAYAACFNMLSAQGVPIESNGTFFRGYDEKDSTVISNLYLGDYGRAWASGPPDIHPRNYKTPLTPSLDIYFATNSSGNIIIDEPLPSLPGELMSVATSMSVIEDKITTSINDNIVNKPLSNITLGALVDLGWVVDRSLAETFTPLVHKLEVTTYDGGRPVTRRAKFISQANGFGDYSVATWASPYNHLRRGFTYTFNIEWGSNPKTAIIVGTTETPVDTAKTTTTTPVWSSSRRSLIDSIRYYKGGSLTTATDKTGVTKIEITLADTSISGSANINSIFIYMSSTSITDIYQRQAEVSRWYVV